jgi:hypothetical protein
MLNLAWAHQWSLFCGSYPCGVLVVITNNPTRPAISCGSFHAVKSQADVQSIGIHAPSRVVAGTRRGQQWDPLQSSLATGAKFWSAPKTGVERKNQGLDLHSAGDGVGTVMMGHCTIIMLMPWHCYDGALYHNHAHAFSLLVGMPVNFFL